MEEGVASAPAPSAGSLFIAFMGVGLSGFGGVLPWARRMLVERRRWMTAAAFADTLALCQSLPGPNIVNLSFVVGGRFAGPRGALAALAGLVLPPLAIVLLLAWGYDHLGSSWRAARATAALAAAGAGLVAATAMKMAAPVVRARPRFAGAILLFAFAGAGVARLPLAAVVGVLAPAAAFGAAIIARRSGEAPTP